MLTSLSGELCVHHARELHRLLLDEIDLALREGRPVELDLSQVTEVDSAGLQLLLMARREIRRRGGELRIARPGDAVKEALAFLGLARHFDEADAGPSA